MAGMLVFRPSFFKVLATAALCLAAIFFSVAGAYCESLQQFAVVRVERLNVRAEPDSAAAVLRVLEKNDRVRVLMEQGEWLQIVVGQQIGYISGHSRYVERLTAHRVTDSGDRKLDVAMARAREIERKIREKQKEIRDIKHQEDVVVEDLQILEQESSEYRQQLLVVMAAAEEAGARICMLETQAAEIRKDLEHRKIKAGNRVSALYRLCRLGSMNLLATAGSAHQLLLRKAAIEKVVAHDETVLKKMQKQKRRLDDVLFRLQAEQKQQKRLVRQYEEILTRLAVRRSKRQQMLASLESRRSEGQNRLEYLREAALRLEDTISALKAKDPGDSADFASYQGLLKMPVQGKIVSEFGKLVTPESGIVNYSNGLEIQSPAGSPVRAVYGGNVAYADWLKGYGRVVILYHGDNYHTVYAHIEDLFCSREQTVKTGQVIATVGDSGFGQGPGLYFEIRHHGNPVNPLQWIESVR
jgi:septal ring factor EnvC (AmiA/AmiB activator)